MQDLSLNVMDIAQNSVVANADLIRISVIENGNHLTISIDDDGEGMTKEQLSRATDPFFTTRTTRKVGMGISLFKMQAEMTDGCLTISSTEHMGTSVKAEFNTDHLDMIPIGDMEGTVRLLIQCNPDRDFLYYREKDGNNFTLDTRELRQILGDDVPLNSHDISAWIGEFLAENIDELNN